MKFIKKCNTYFCYFFFFVEVKFNVQKKIFFTYPHDTVRNHKLFLQSVFFIQEELINSHKRKKKCLILTRIE